MRVLVALSGGVDSSVAAALLVDAGHDVVGATLKLWGGSSDSGCCSVADVDDARRVADRLGIEHHVFNLTDRFTASVVDPYVAAHAAGLTPNPCIECNRHVKFGALLQRAELLGFDLLATGHHARCARDERSGRHVLRRGKDTAKDQSYVLAMLREPELARCTFPVGELTKSEVRAEAARRGLRTAAKPDSEDVCFIASRTTPGARAAFLGGRIPLHRAAVVERATGAEVGSVAAAELVTIGQRRGLGIEAPRSVAMRQYALEVDVDRRRVYVGRADELLVSEVLLEQVTAVHEPLPFGTEVLVQVSAHAAVRAAVVTEHGIRYRRPERAVAPGQTVAIYLDDEVVGSGIVGAPSGV
jgi:tRNA-specific 2-thiouridylase